MYLLTSFLFMFIPGPSSSASTASAAAALKLEPTDYGVVPATPDNSFVGFCGLCGRLEKEPSYNAKTKLIYTYLKYGNSGGQDYGKDVY